jgi:putative DNA methylase
MTAARKKLIEVSLPLDAINAASAHEKSIRHGHPSTLHLWWARRPLAAARAVIWTSLVDDPSSLPERFPTPGAQAKERDRLFDILKKLVEWENTNDALVLEETRAEIRRSSPLKTEPIAKLQFCNSNGVGRLRLERSRPRLWSIMYAKI